MVDYPKQICIVWGGNNSSLSATFELMAPKETGSVAPLQMHEGNLSRFMLTLLDTSSGATIPLIGNIPATDVPVLTKKTDIAMFLKEQNKQLPEQVEKDKDICYTQELKFGKYKGKTPAAVLLENADAKEELISHKAFLKQNVAKYPANQTQMDAIDNAIMLFDVGELKSDPVKPQSTSHNNMVVYDKKFKSTRRKNAKGLFLCYNINITCHYHMNYPWVVTIENYYAPSINGKIDHKNATDHHKASLRISDDDWSYMVSQFENLKKMYENTQFSSLLERANLLVQQQIEEAKAKR